MLITPSDGPVAGVFLFDPAGPVGSVFARTRGDADPLLAGRSGLYVYSEVELPGPSEGYSIYHRAPCDPLPGHRMRHSIRLATEQDQEQVYGLMRSVLGGIDRRWFQGLPSDRERCFVSEIGAELAGVAWLLTVGGHARLHSLVVAPQYRGLGIGTDLLFARLLWSSTHGAGEVVSEIAATNLSSQRVAQHAGMEPRGRLFLSWRPRAPEPYP